jgi:PAS domain S-box-containing protein
MEMEVRLPSGRSWFVEASGAPVRDAQGNVFGGLAVTADISKRKREEEEIRKLNRTLRALSKSNQALMAAADEKTYLWDVCMIIMEDCGHAMVWIGYAQNDGAKSVRPVAHAGFEEGYLETLQVNWADTERGRGPTGAAIRTGKPQGCRNMLTDPAFAPWREEAIKRGYASSLALPLRVGGQVFGAITIYAREPDAFSEDEVNLLTELADDLAYGVTYLRTQAARLQAEKALRESEERLRLAQVSANIGIWDWKPQTGEVMFTAEHERLYGLARGSIRRYKDWQKHVHPEDLARIEAERDEAIADRKPFDLEFRIVRPSGELRWVCAKGSAFYNERGEAVRVLGANVDITDRKLADEELKERTAQLEAANKELESFSYSVSHDLRAPLRAIDGYTRMILKSQGGNFDEETLRKFNVIRDNAHIMGQLIDELLSFSRLGKKALALSQLDVNAIVGEVWKELKAANPERDMTLTLGSIPPALGDRALVRQVYCNLLSNAVKFTIRRDAARIEAGSFAAGNETVYYVRDNGAGFDMAYYDKLFGVFQRLHSTEDFEGTGVGLATVQRIIHRHGGRVWAEGKVDGGACFYFTLAAPAGPSTIS